MGQYNVIMLVFGVIFIIIQSLIINYLVQLEKTGCECAMDWRRQFILFFLVLSIVYTITSFLIDERSLPLLQTTMVIIGLLNVIFTLQYVNKLKEKKCDCSQSVYRDIMMFIAIFNAIIYALMLTIIIYFMFTMMTYSKNAHAFKGKKQISIKPMTPKKLKL